MKNIVAIVSMLHQPAGRLSSATRLFRREAVLGWTLRRLALARAGGVGQRAILCWEDQMEAVRPVATMANVPVLAKGPRCAIPSLDAISAAQRWAEGWRGGLLATCCFDAGFFGPWHLEILRHFQADGALLVDPDAALVDPALLDGLIEHARRKPHLEYCFSPAAPGLSGVLIGRAMLEQFAATQTHPGKLLHYWPDISGRDPLATEHCVRVPTAVARTTHRFMLNCDRQAQRIERMTVSMNGQLMQTEAEALVSAAEALPRNPDELPRDLTLEINSTRATSPIYWPGRHLPILRSEMPLEQAKALLAELGACDDLRLTLGGLGDPLLSESVFDIIAVAAEAGISAIHLETDFASVDADRVRKLAGSPVDVVSVNLPALNAPTYQAVMGREGLAQAVENVRQFLLARRELGRGTPILVPTFVKCRENLHEMEAWYDYWLRAAGSAVIAPPSSCAGQIPDCGVADMSPPRRHACRRLGGRMMVLCNGQAVACENDVMARQAIGESAGGVRQMAERLSERRALHAAGKWDDLPLCGKCREWDRW